MRRSLILTVALMLALAGAVVASVATAPAPDAGSSAVAIDSPADLPGAVRIDCWQEERWDYEGYYDEGWERVTVYKVYSRKCWDSWGGVVCGDWQYQGQDEVRTSIDGGGGGLGD